MNNNNNTSSPFAEPLLEMEQVDAPQITGNFQRHTEIDNTFEDAVVEMHTSQQEMDSGSSIRAATFNFTNSIIGAGSIGLGGAIANSGGLVSLATIVACAALVKASLDLLIALSVRAGQDSYEGLAQAHYGTAGLMSVLTSKFLYSFGCLVAYVVVAKDNFGVAISDLAFPNDETPSAIYAFLNDAELLTWTMSTIVILPLCLLRDMTPLASASVVSIVSMFCIVGIVIYLYLGPDASTVRLSGGTTYEKWVVIQPAYLQSLGTFVFCFASQHTVHLTFNSLKPSLRTVDNWKTISSWSVGMACSVSLAVSFIVYMTFWDETESDIFVMYPNIALVDLAKLFLCVAMLLTFPLPFFTCRELLIVSLTWKSAFQDESTEDNVIDVSCADAISLQQPLLEEVYAPLGPAASEVCTLDQDCNTTSSDALIPSINERCSWLIPGREKQLKPLYHVLITGTLWFLATWLAIAAPSLGDVLDLVGCATGTLIAFIFPGMLAVRVHGYAVLAILLLSTGSVVGIMGTFYSIKELIADSAGER
jgi:amino acid permease